MTNSTPDEQDRPANLDDALTAATSAIDIALSRAENAISSSAGTEVELRTDNAVETKRRLAAGFSEITHAANDARAAAASAQLEAKKIIDEAQAMLRAKLAELEPMLAHAKRLEDGISAVNLYLGRDEYIETLREGTPAKPGTPLVIRQQVLAMDEESALHAETGGIDFKGIGEFIEWMLAEPEHLDQILPDQLGVISVMARRSFVDYGNPFENDSKNEMNKESWWIIRNGEQLYLHRTDFTVGSRLVPLRDEFTKMFEQKNFDGTIEPLTPGSNKWLKAEQAADLTTRHYMKIALILQGLIDRTTVFRPLPVEGLSVLGQKHYEEGFVRIIADDELALTSGRPTFRQFQLDAIAKMDVGMRLIGFFNGYGKENEGRTTPAHASRPSSLVPHTITGADGSNLIFTYDRTDDVASRDQWGRQQYGPAKTRASYRLDRTPWQVVRWLPIDGLNADDLRYYLGSRSERHEYIGMFPILKAAIAFLEKEDAEETPFRALIAAELVNTAYADDASADASARELILWWKTKNKWHRALNGAGDHERKAQTHILAEASRRTSGADREADIAKAILALHPDAMVVARRTSDFVALVPEQRKAAGATNLFVTVHEFTGTGKPRKSKIWQTLTHAQISRWTILHRTADWDSWKIGAKTAQYLTDEQIDMCVESVLDQVRAAGRTPVVVAYMDGSDGNEERPRFQVATTSTFNRESNDLRQGKITLRVRVVNSGLVVGNYSDGRALRFSDTRWSTKHDWNDRSVRGAEAPMDVNYSGDVHPSGRVWADDNAIAAEMALGAEWYAESGSRSAAQHRAQALYMELCTDWERRNEQRVYARFLEDFGDPTLWEGHKKALKDSSLSYPYRRTTSPASQIDDLVRAVGRIAARRDDRGRGMTVQQFMDEHSIAAAVEIPADVLELAFPAKV